MEQLRLVLMCRPRWLGEPAGAAPAQAQPLHARTVLCVNLVGAAQHAQHVPPHRHPPPARGRGGHAAGSWSTSAAAASGRGRSGPGGTRGIMPACPAALLPAHAAMPLALLPATHFSMRYEGDSGSTRPPRNRMVAGSAARPRLSRQPQPSMYCVPARVVGQVAEGRREARPLMMIDGRALRCRRRRRRRRRRRCHPTRGARQELCSRPFPCRLVVTAAQAPRRAEARHC